MTSFGNIEMEQIYLGCLLQKNDLLYAFDRLSPDDFYEEVHRDIYAESVRRIDANETADPVLLFKHFEHHPALEVAGGGKYMARLAASASGFVPLAEYISEIKRLAMTRKILTACHQALGEIHTGDKGPSEIASSLMGDVQNTLIGNTRKAITGSEVALQILEGMKDNKEPFSTGLRKLDACMGGGLYPGKSYGFAALSAVGKTTIANTISHNLDCSGVKHAFICGEMGPQGVYERTIARTLGAAPSAFKGENRKDWVTQQRVAQSAIDYGKNILFHKAPGLTFSDMKQIFGASLFRDKVSGVILDYWQLVGGKPKDMSKAEHLDAVAQWIADFCEAHGIWAITMSQINREGQTRGSDGLVLAFEQVYEIHREDKSSALAWVEMKKTRYTAWCNIGSKEFPGWMLNPNGPFFEEI